MPHNFCNRHPIYQRRIEKRAVRALPSAAVISPAFFTSGKKEPANGEQKTGVARVPSYSSTLVRWLLSRWWITWCAVCVSHARAFSPQAAAVNCWAERTPFARNAFELFVLSASPWSIALYLFRAWPCSPRASRIAIQISRRADVLDALFSSAQCDGLTGSRWIGAWKVLGTLMG